MVGHGGASINQDSRFRDKQKILKETLKFPSIFSEKVDVRKVNMDVMKPWIAQRVYDTLQVEDEVLIEYIYSLLEASPFPDPKEMQVNLTGFLEGKTARFMNDLWKLLVDAQSSISGIPSTLVEAKRREFEDRRGDNEKLILEIRRRNRGESPVFPAGGSSNVVASADLSEMERIKLEAERRDEVAMDRRRNNRRPLPPPPGRHDRQWPRYRSRSKERRRFRSRSRSRSPSLDRYSRSRRRDRSRDRSDERRYRRERSQHRETRYRSRDRSRDREIRYISRDRSQERDMRHRSKDRSQDGKIRSDRSPKEYRRRSRSTERHQRSPY